MLQWLQLYKLAHTHSLQKSGRQYAKDFLSSQPLIFRANESIFAEGIIWLLEDMVYLYQRLEEVLEVSGMVAMGMAVNRQKPKIYPETGRGPQRPSAESGGGHHMATKMFLGVGEPM